MGDDALLAEQVAYYRARAPEYDDWWERTGRYELEADLQSEWFVDREHLERMVDGWVADAPGRRILELACGTGNWTQRLGRLADRLVAVDSSKEVVAIAKTKLPEDVAGRVEFVDADLFSWTPPPAAFDVVFFSFWLSHVPPDLFEPFWAMVGSALAPGGRAILIDNKWGDGVWPGGEKLDGHVQQRDLHSGELYNIVKVYYEPGELTARLEDIGWRAEVTTTSRFFIAGHASRS
jgi:demethylmenaquinone methyltransferase/2-methoxy-6-polyprenyl-1,4-benzoquinol methylase